MNGVLIKYGDYAPEAKENFTAVATEKADFINLEQLQEYNLNVKNYANACEYWAVLLDGNAAPFPEQPQDRNMGYWSNAITQSDKTFAESIVITLTSDGQYSSKGFTFTFDTDNNIYCDGLSISWRRVIDGVETVLSEKDFTPTSAFYLCENKVSNFNKVIITFNSLNMPYNRLKLRSIDFGYGTTFTSDELLNVKVIQEINTLSKEISINVVDFELRSKNDFNYSFQKKQPITVYFNDKLIQTCFVDTSTRQGKRDWSVKTTDYVGLLDTVLFMGDIYTNKNAVELLETIFEQTNIPYTIDSSLNAETITGHIPICSCREALKQICFAIGAIVDTSYSDKVQILPLSTAEAEVIPINRILQGQRFKDNSAVTSVELTAHKYMQNATGATELYKASESGAGTDILVKFEKPCYNISITNGTITKSSANFAIITANSNCILSGYQYEDVTTVKIANNPDALTSDPENVVVYNGYTLISAANLDKILNLCYTESIKVNQISFKAVEGKHKSGNQWIYDSEIDLSKNYVISTEYLGDITARIVSQRYNLNGGIIIKECEAI